MSKRRYDVMTSDRKALCVGIDNVENFPQYALRGCVNDANSMSLLLKQYLGFNDSDITILLNSEATTENIIENLTSMAQGAKEGKYNYIVFTLATHGTQIPDISGDEEYDDRKDEVFCPYDLKTKDDTWDPNHIIVDDQLGELFFQLPQNVLLEAFFDTCHSGDGLRDILLNQMPRYICPPSYQVFERLQNKNMHPLHET